jgi:site-specific DNA-methyltransferase (adenine-specific)
LENIGEVDNRPRVEETTRRIDREHGENRNMIEVNKIHNMDCLDGLKLLDDECIDLTVTSPPYDNLRTYNGFKFDFTGIAKELYRVTKKGGVVVWVVADATINGSETGTSFRQALYFKKLGFNLHDTMIWEKPTFTATGSLKVRYAPVFEYMFVLSKGKPKTFNPIKDKKNVGFGRDKNHGTVRQKDGSTKPKSNQGKSISEYGQRHNVWNMSGENSNINRFHPAQFPEQLANDHIISWSNENDIVLDIFMGSGTTAKMSLMNNRRFIGFEISKEYCDIANERIKQVSLFEVKT